MESAFQFKNPALTHLEFEVNEGFDNQKNEEVQIRINMSVQVSKSSNSNEALVGLKFEIGEMSEDCPFYIKAVEEAYFKWENILEEEKVNQLLNQNAPSLLLSYLRPIVVQITSASPYDAYNIPFINFASNK